jgi:HEAT repeat protein/nucleoside phosphorylase
MDEKNYPYDVFISYRWVTPDQDWVREQLYPALVNVGLKVCLDVTDFVPGRDLILEMERAGLESRHVICVLSPEYFAEDRMVGFESLSARRRDPSGRNSSLIPLVFRETPIPERIRGLIPIDWTNPEDREREWNKLLRVLGAKDVDKPFPGSQQLQPEKQWVETYPGTKRTENSQKKAVAHIDAESGPLIDFAIITAVKVEREAICKAFSLTDKHRVRKGARVYWRGRLPLKDGSSYEIVVAQSPDMANVDAALLTLDTLRDWRPHSALMVGIAASAGTEANMGDVVTGSDVYYYERGKLKPEGVKPEPKIYPADAVLWANIIALPAWKTRIHARRPDGKRLRPKSLSGIIASGEKVIAEAAARDQIASVHRKILAIEMEGYGFSKAVWQSFDQVRHLVIRAICDDGSSTKNDEWQAYAAAAAASYAKHFLADAPISPRGAPPSDEKMETHDATSSSRRPAARSAVDEVIGFLEKFGRNGLVQHALFRPESVPADRLLEFCLPARIVDEQEWAAVSRKLKGRKLENDSEHQDYIFPTDEAFLRAEKGEDAPRFRPLENVLAGIGAQYILRGEPGEGKTTALWMHVAKRCEELVRSLRSNTLKPDSSDLVVPLVLILAEVQPADGSPDLVTLAVESALKICYGNDRPEIIVKWLKEKVQRREFELCLDALDEFPVHQMLRPGAVSPRKWLRQELAKNYDVRILLTTRLSTDDSGLLDNPRRLRLACFSAPQVRLYIERFFQGLPEGMRLAQELRSRLILSPGPRYLAQLPLLLAVLCRRMQNFPDAPLPRTRTGILKLGLKELLERGDQRRGLELRRPNRNQAKEEVLQEVAWRFHAARPLPFTEDVLLALLEDQLANIKHDPPASPDALLHEYLQDGVLVRNGPDTYGFILRSLHEYCLAGWIARQAPVILAKNEDQFKLVIHGATDAWGRSQDWGDICPLMEEEWQHVWPLVAGQMRQRASWFIKSLWESDPNLENPTLRSLICEATIEIPTEIPEYRKLRTFLSSRLDSPQSPNIWRHGAAIALGKLGGDNSRELLEKWLRNTEAEDSIRSACAIGLYYMADEHSRAVLMEHFFNADVPEKTHEACAVGLLEFADEPFRKRLIDQLNNNQVSEGVRNDCAKELAQAFGDEQSMDVLIKLLNDENIPADLRGFCANGLGILGEERCRVVLAAHFNDTGNPQVSRMMCAVSLGYIGDKASLTLLLNHLMENNASEAEFTRIGCILGLREIPYEQSREALITCLNNTNESENIRKIAGFALGHIKDAYSRAALVTQLNNAEASDEIRKGCAHGLGEIGDEFSRDALIACMNNTQVSSEVRSFCAGVVPWIGDDICTAALSERVLDEMTPVELRIECARSLEKTKNVKAFIPLLHQLLKPTTPDQLRQACIQTIREGFDGYLMSFLVSTLGNPDDSTEMRESCAHLLAQIGGDQARQALIERLEDQDTDAVVRIACANGLSVVDDEQSRQAVIKQVKNREAAGEIRLACASILATFNDDSLATLVDCFNDSQEFEYFRWWCAACFPLSQDESFLQSLITWLNDPSTSEELRLNYVSILGRVGGVRRRLFLLRWRDDSRTAETIRQACMEAIAAIDANFTSETGD